jgi:phage terminase Nu1 subunit (DNA packaging protein)
VPTHKPDLSLLSLSQLSELTGRSPDTIRQRLDGLDPAKQDGRTRWYASRDALPRIYEALDLSAERARLAREQADGLAMKNAQMRGELVPIADVEAGYLAITSPIATKLDGLPSKAAPEVRATSTDAEAEAVLRRHITEARTELADVGLMARASGSKKRRDARARGAASAAESDDLAVVGL